MESQQSGLPSWSPLKWTIIHNADKIDEATNILRQWLSKMNM